MPQVIPFAVAYAASNAAAAAGATVAAQATIAATAATVAASVQTTALIVGASYALSRLTAQPNPQPSEGSIEFKQPMPFRFFHYGHCKISGPVALLETHGNHLLLKITLLGCRPFAHFHKVYSDGNNATLLLEATADPNVFTIPEYWFQDGPHGLMNWHLGATDQVADADLLAEFTDGWTANHRLRGIPYVFGKLESGDPENHQGAFPNGEPQFSCVGGIGLYDPRKDSTRGGSGSHRLHDQDTWEYSDNQRLCCLDWLLYSEGYGKGIDRIDLESWTRQLDMADEEVPLKAGGTERRYRLATRVSLDEPRSRVLSRIMQAGDQQLYVTRDGKIGTRGGVWEEPTVTLADSDLKESSMTHGVPLMDRCNQFQLSCLLGDHGYIEVDLEPWSDTGDPFFQQGIVRRLPLSLPQVPSNSQAQRLAKIYMGKRNCEWSGPIKTGFAGLDAIGEMVVRLQNGELGIDGPFFVNGKIGFSEDRTGVTMTVSSARAETYEWDAATEEQPAPPLAMADDGSEA